MRIVYFDIDTLRADHVGCYGYERATTPNIDAVAAEGIRFDNVYASDTPCLPSRTALSSGRFGTRSGVVGHGGTAADPRPEGAQRGFRSRAATETWASLLQRAGFWTASLSTFPERHSAFHFLAGFNEWHNLGTRGLETADQVSALTLEWLSRHRGRGDWFLHVHFWDPHTPYRTPLSFGDPFAAAPTPAWLTEEVRAAHWMLPGPHSAQEMAGFGPRQVWDAYPRQPEVANDMAAVRRMFDGYDTGVQYADMHVGLILDALKSQGVYDDTAVIVSSDHGETLGELGVYCDHQTADHQVCRVPLVIRWPGVGPGATGRNSGLHYQFDAAATVLELVGLEIPSRWDAKSFGATFGSDRPDGREHLVLTQGAWTAQRAVRFGEYISIHTYHDGFHGFPETMLFDLSEDPHEQHDLAASHGAEVRRAAALLESWLATQLRGQPMTADPLQAVLSEGGPWHARPGYQGYLRRLQETGRARWATSALGVPRNAQLE